MTVSSEISNQRKNNVSSEHNYSFLDGPDDLLESSCENSLTRFVDDIIEEAKQKSSSLFLLASMPNSFYCPELLPSLR